MFQKHRSLLNSQGLKCSIAKSFASYISSNDLLNDLLFYFVLSSGLSSKTPDIPVCFNLASLPNCKFSTVGIISTVTLVFANFFKISILLYCVFNTLSVLCLFMLRCSSIVIKLINLRWKQACSVICLVTHSMVQNHVVYFRATFQMFALHSPHRRIYLDTSVLLWKWFPVSI